LPRALEVACFRGISLSQKQTNRSTSAEPESQTPSMPDRRRSPRLNVLLRLEYEAQQDLAADYATDLADGGLFIRTDLNLEVGTRVGVSLSFPGLLEPTVIDCVVRWRRTADAETPREQVGVGVEFVGSLPEQQERVRSLLQRLEKPTTKRPSQSAMSTFRVLLVEDNAFVSELFRHAVLKLHHELVDYESHDLMMARTGHEALRMLGGDRKPDVVILDHYLPGITGCSLVRRIRSMPDHQRTPILMISMGGDEFRREALASGATLYLDKPILLTQLLDTLRALTTKERTCD
jgi:uncharacterized protein (TIGR02266 family)